MKLIDDLIDSLTEKNNRLTDILIKTKVLAFKLKNKPLINWIDSELNGYGENELPTYRIVNCQVKGTISNGYQRANNYPIPLLGIDKEYKDLLVHSPISQSISTLDDFVHSNGNQSMSMIIPAELYNFLNQSFDSGFVVEYAAKNINRAQIVELITAARTKLLDFLLELNEEIGESEDLTKLSDPKKENINSLFNSSVFGNNTTIIVGDHNKQKVKINNTIKNDIDKLSDLFKSNGVEQSDLESLKNIIEIDNPDYTNHTLGNEVKKWMNKMMAKAIDGTWQIGVGAAGSLLAEGFSKYYGWT